MDVTGDIVGRRFYLAETEAIVGSCAMIPDIGGPPNRHLSQGKQPRPMAQGFPSMGSEST